MTKQELIKILDEKIENAENNLKIENEEYIKEYGMSFDYCQIKGELRAYIDIKNLLENEVLEDDR